MPKRLIEITSVGNELLTGHTVNTIAYEPIIDMGAVGFEPTTTCV